jgi:hypothetical protein
LRAFSVKIFLAERRKYMAFEILEEMKLMWNLKFNEGSIKMPKNFTAGNSELAVTFSSGKIKLGSLLPELL